ncbi:MAG: hypothetical protein BRD35_06270 [Bacteroidetes bacterium QH_7_62_13]|nr:MAG: hypothetical protein BRD35_06270 [Bacteroidetes bacterium QH_7_62_13]
MGKDVSRNCSRRPFSSYESFLHFLRWVHEGQGRSPVQSDRLSADGVVGPETAFAIPLAGGNGGRREDYSAG